MLPLPRLELGSQLIGMNQVAFVRLVDRGFQRSGGQQGCDVQQSPGRCRHWDPGTARRIALKGGAAMGDDVGLAPDAVARDRDVNELVPLAADPPECAGAEVTEHCTSSATQNRGHPLALPSEFRATDCVDATPHWMESSLRDTVLDRAHREAELEQLKQSDDSVLCSSQLPYPPREVLAIQGRHHVPEVPKAPDSPPWVPGGLPLRRDGRYQWMPRISEANMTCSVDASSAVDGAARSPRGFSPRAALESGNSL